MQVFEATPKKWGNSLGITIPKEIISKEHLSTNKKVKFIAIGPGMDRIKNAFGSVKLKKSTQQAMKEIDEGYD